MRRIQSALTALSALLNAFTHSPPARRSPHGVSAHPELQPIPALRAARCCCSAHICANKPFARSNSACVPRSTIRPLSITMICCACTTVDSRCAMISVVRSRAIRSSSCWIARSERESSAEVASSNSRIGRILENRARDRHALLFAARELQAALADRRLVTLRQSFDELVNMRRARRGDHFLARGRRTAISDVVVDRIVEQHRILRHDADRRAQRILRDVANILTVDGDRAARRTVEIVEAEHQPRERRFARTAMSDHRRRRAGRNREAHVVQNLPRRLIRKIHMLETHLRAAHPQRRRVRPDRAPPARRRAA